jgi:NTP pyrophosphatase (non-canonical NTP hydrolase)
MNDIAWANIRSILAPTPRGLVETFMRHMIPMAMFGKRSTQETSTKPGRGSRPHSLSEGSVNLKLAMRKLWSDHVIWTRDYVVAAVAGSPSTQESANRLLANQDDIGKAIVPYYGKEAGTELTRLLKEHITIAVELVDAAKKDDKKKFKDANDRWSANANEIAKFLAGANPNWPEKTVADMLSLHLELTVKEASARLKKDWKADTKAFDDIFTEIMTLADALADGIVKQFPEKF